jgi:imipenem/basic amino acid-specific outer membrane pore
MKLVKMSMVAALLVGSSAFAVENVKVSGDANIFYLTSDENMVPNTLAGTDGSLFSKDSSAADASLNLDVSADLVKNDLVTVSGKVGYTVLSTLGLENNFVSNVWGSGHTATAGTGQAYAGTSHDAALGVAVGGAKVEEANYFTEAFVTVGAGNSALQLGRMELDTPLAFTEKWSAEKNTFEAAVIMNKDIPDTTVVGAYIGNGNGNEALGTGSANDNFTGLGLGLPTGSNLQSNVQTLGLAKAGVVNANGQFGTFGTDGAYALAVVNNSFKPLTAQAWYYRVTNVADAYWLQADLNMEGILAGIQYSSIDLDAGGDSNVMAAMLGYEMKDVVTVKVAYSQVADDAAFGANLATSTGNTKLYTKTFWNYGQDVVTAVDTDAMKLSVSSPVNGLFDACASYTAVDRAGTDFTEIALVAKKSFGPLDVKAALINYDDETAADAVNMVQAYLTLNF